MKIFFSHSSRDKAVIRDVMSRLPKHVKVWIDESELLQGMDVEDTLRRAIDFEADYVVVFLSNDSIRSPWVSRELKWALSREQELGREFVLPVLLDEVWDRIKPAAFRRKKYLECFDQSERGMEAFTQALSAELFAWISKRTEREHQSEEVVKAFTKGLSKMESEVPTQWLRDFGSLADRISSLTPELQLERLSERVDRDLGKWRSTEERTKADLESREDQSDSDAFSRLGLAMYAVSVVKMIDRLQEIKEEIDFWKSHRSEMSATDTLAHVRQLLVSA